MISKLCFIQARSGARRATCFAAGKSFASARHVTRTAASHSLVVRTLATMSTSGVYEKAFPGIPRVGIAAVTVGPKAPESTERTIAYLKTKEEITPATPSLASKDSEKDPVQITYENVDGKEARVLTVSLGPAAKVDAAAFRKAATAIVNKLRGLKATSVEVAFPTIAGVPAAKAAQAFVQAATLTNFAFDRYLTTEDKVPTFLSSIHITTSDAAVEAAANAAAILTSGTIFARDMVNERADEMNPERIEAVAKFVADQIGAQLTVVKGQGLIDAGLHLMAAVGQAALHPARYIELKYAGDPANPDDVIMVVGKGITFDTGGLNIKGTGFMEDMHMDMGGCAAVLGSALAASKLGLKRNVVFVCAVAENAIDSLAYKPHAVIKSHKGLTVEIGNTDAEGRLVLADALSFGQQRNKPHTIIDLATLTGACIVGLGEYAAGLFSNSNALRAGLQAASEASNERLWPMPIFQEHRDELKAAAQADLQSTGAGRYGGACTAAAFLEYFIGHEPSKNAREAAPAPAAGDAAPAPAKPSWAHLDIAGPGMYSTTRGFMIKGGTGFGVQVVAQYLLSAPKGALPADETKKF